MIEPAAAFGTGTHETTQGCLALLEEAVSAIRKSHDAVTILDVGCGSGILAIAGAKLGAAEVLAIDNDPVAVESAGKNVLLNRVEGTVKLMCVPLADINEQYQIVIANLDPSALRENRNKLLSLFQEFLIVSGVPLNQRDQVSELLREPGVVQVKEITRSEWWCVLFSRTPR